MKRRKVDLLVMAYGTPYQESDIVPYYTHIQHGKTPTDEMVKDLSERYQAIGGISPLAQITLEQASKLEQALNQQQEEI
ncbi:Ferrochelatase 1 [Halalkalibacter krulwichiae]|uniref:Ferrochelatase 1 n=1 Tax=Halalkalibacter krulwichiae TaxID=199441 RepID=A0A1X9MB16_9BACI|nr:Ferrochelatase 1 [Halalkalibacter krulwichiae]